MGTASQYKAHLPKVEASDAGDALFQPPSPQSRQGSGGQPPKFRPMGSIQAIYEPFIKLSALGTICKLFQHAERLFQYEEARI